MSIAEWTLIAVVGLVCEVWDLHKTLRTALYVLRDIKVAAETIEFQHDPEGWARRHQPQPVQLTFWQRWRAAVAARRMRDEELRGHQVAGR